MRLLKKKCSEFKIIPEARIVIGEKKYDGEKKRKSGSLPFPTWSLIQDALFENQSFDVWSNEIHVSATAYCDEKDEFDERKGVDICEEKIDMKYHDKLARTYKRAADTLEKAARAAMEISKRHSDTADAIRDDLCKTYGRMPL